MQQVLNKNKQWKAIESQISQEAAGLRFLQTAQRQRSTVEYFTKVHVKNRYNQSILLKTHVLQVFQYKKVKLSNCQSIQKVKFVIQEIPNEIITKWTDLSRQTAERIIPKPLYEDQDHLERKEKKHQFYRKEKK